MKPQVAWPVMILLGAVGGVLAVGAFLYARNARRVNHVALADSAKRVATIAAAPQPFQPTRHYVGTIEPWLEANIGPQLVSAYVATVLVRPGAVAKHGDVLATLDCRNTSAISRQVAEQARSLDATSTAAANEATRVNSLLQGKYVSQNEAEEKSADAASKQAQVAALRAQLASTSLQVDDCVLRAPFDGEVSERHVDPGAFVRPGQAIATLVDRHLVRIATDVPEEDFDAVTPGTEVRLHLLSTGRDLVAKISRRSPSADRETRTAHVEIDVEDPDRSIPVWTTAEIALDAGAPLPATAIPMAAASVHGERASIFFADGGIAHLHIAPIIGETNGTLFLDPKAVPAGTSVVTEGRAILSDGDAIR